MKKNLRYQIYKGSASGSTFFYTIFDTEVFECVDEVNNLRYYTCVAETYDKDTTEQIVSCMNGGKGCSYVKNKYTSL